MTNSEALRFDYEISAPWLSHYGTVPAHLSYPDGSMVDAITEVAEKYPDYTAFTFQGRKTSYQEMLRQITRVGRAFAAAGIKKDDRVTVCMPN